MKIALVALALFLSFVSAHAAGDSPFSNSHPAYDMINHKKYQHVIIGPTNREFNPLANFQYWRYVTVYNVVSVPEQRISHWPIIHEECHDEGWRVGNWEQQISYSAEFRSELKIGDLGFSAQITMSVTNGMSYTVSRAVQGTKNLAADHVPYLSHENWEGVTFVQVYSNNEGPGYITSKPFQDYPYSFRLTNQNATLKIKRENVKHCPGYKPEDDNGDHGPPNRAVY